MRSTSSSAWSQGTFSSSAVTVPCTPRCTITLRPLIWAKVRSTSVTSALVTLRSIGSPKYGLSFWFRLALRCARPCSGVATGETSTGLPIGALTPGCEPIELAVGAAPRAGVTATGPVGEGGAAAGIGEASSVWICTFEVFLAPSAGGLRCASARSEGSGPVVVVVVVVVWAGVVVVVVVWVVVPGAGSTTFAFDILVVAGLVVLPAAFAGFAGAGAGAAGAGAGAAVTAGIGAGVPSAAGKEITSASPVRSIVGIESPRRSNTTRATALGAGLNCATRTRSTTLPSTGTEERWLWLTTPLRSTTKRRGSESANVEYGSSPSPEIRTTAPPVEESTSTALSWVAAAPVGAGPTIGLSGVPAAAVTVDGVDVPAAGAGAGLAGAAGAGAACAAGGSAALAVELLPGAAGSSWSGSKASLPFPSFPGPSMGRS